MKQPTILRRGATRRAAQEYVERCYARNYFPTTDEITEAAMGGTNHFTVYGLVNAIRGWTRREVLAMMEERDRATRLRRHLIVQDEDGHRRWHPHGQMSFSDLDNSGRFVTRPQADSQRRAERRRDIERQVVEQMERDLERSVTADEAWPRVEPLLRAEGLL